MSWCPKTGPGGIFQSVTLGVADMRGNPWVVSGLFEMVCNEFRMRGKAMMTYLVSIYTRIIDFADPNAGP